MSKRKGHARRPTPGASRASRPLHTAAALRAVDATESEADSFRSPLARVLDTPHLAQLVTQLAPETLHQLIQHSGLPACGPLVASATPEQLTRVLDLDLWRHAQPGRDEQFDADRFGDWLELLADTGDSVAARIVAALDEHLVIAGLSRYVRVFDASALAQPSSSDDEQLDRDVPRDGLECAVGGYLVCAIRADAWDAIVALLLALDAEYHDCFHAVMRGCRRLSDSRPEVDGLDDLLWAPEQLLHDVTLDREQRRSQQGYSTPADARAFLQLARQPRRQRADGASSMNPVAAAYFRAAEESVASADRDLSPLPSRTVDPAFTGESDSGELEAIVGLLAEAGLVPQRPRALLEGAGPEPPSRLTQIRRLMKYIQQADSAAYSARGRELAFLGNTLMAGCSLQSRPFTIQEASDAVVAICNLGLERWPKGWPEHWPEHSPERAPEAETRDAASSGDRDATLPDAFLVSHDLVMAFEVGWATLHQDVSLFVAERLIVTLRDLRCDDPTIKSGLTALRRELMKQHQAGTPWRARDALDAIATLDMPAWASLLGLLDECPVLPAALTATLHGHVGAVSATAFEFIATTGQIGDVRAFMGKLLDTLSS